MAASTLPFDRQTMTEKLKEQLSGIAAPVLMTVVGFFLIQTYLAINRIEVKLDANQSELARLKQVVMTQEAEIRELRRYTRENDEWIRAWLEKYQGAVEWAKKNSEP